MHIWGNNQLLYLLILWALFFWLMSFVEE